MRRSNPVQAPEAEREQAALREIVRLLAKQAAAEHVRTALRGGGSRP